MHLCLLCLLSPEIQPAQSCSEIKWSREKMIRQCFLIGAAIVMFCGSGQAQPTDIELTAGFCLGVGQARAWLRERMLEDIRKQYPRLPPVSSIDGRVLEAYKNATITRFQVYLNARGLDQPWRYSDFLYGIGPAIIQGRKAETECHQTLEAAPVDECRNARQAELTACLKRRLKILHDRTPGCVQRSRCLPENTHQWGFPF